MTKEYGQTVDVLVVGAGMAGLIAAAELQGAGCRVLVLDKGRGVGRRLLAAASGWLGADVQTFQVHGWLYSKPLQVEDYPCAMVSQDPLLVLAGDAFAGPRLEGAALSGWAAAEALRAGAS